jgi:uncharacterized protein (DUF779 family)
MDGVSVVLTDAAREAIERVRAERGDDLSLVIGNGCCDSTAPFLFSHYLAGPNEPRVAEAAGVPVLLDAALVELFAGHEVVIDCGPDRAGDGFSAETELGLRLTMQRLPSAGPAAQPSSSAGPAAQPSSSAGPAAQPS